MGIQLGLFVDNEKLVEIMCIYARMEKLEWESYWRGRDSKVFPGVFYG